MWICPACQLPLTRHAQQWQCDNRHSYDIGKEGHVNLLLANQKNSKDPGDNKDMINARRAFLDGGYYQPLAQHLADLISQFSRQYELNVYDAGCGEGYYLNFVSRQLTQGGFTIHPQGSDIAKVAIQKAAKKYPNANFSVASSFHLPVLSSSLDVIMEIFAPVDSAEMQRVLKPGGLWLQVNPVGQHLWQLKQALYQTPQVFSLDPVIADGFTLLDQQSLQFELAINELAQRENLLKMTPYYWSTPVDKKDAVLNALKQVSIEFSVSVLQKSEGTE
ncbi:putative RNA methyltransferase [Neptunicella sp.]|uniref:putative RNA methyltransferase n=1 Tax=Neptunicella sp. TaxID=2125986 RepID=UPI003F68CB44